MMWYKPYQKLLPEKQAKLLLLWDELGIPHDENKQLSGSVLKIIGFEVDANEMTFTMPAEEKEELIAYITSFSDGVWFPLKEWQHLSGWLNWP
jgi:hypothetical protein